MKITIKNIEQFVSLLDSITTIIGSSNGCKFILTPEESEVRLVNEAQTCRAFFNTNSIVSEAPTEFSFTELDKLKKSMNLIKNVEGKTEADIDFNNTFISYIGNVKFKLKVAKPEMVERFLAMPIKSVITTTFSFITDAKAIKLIMSYIPVVNDAQSKVYFIMSPDKTKILAEIDDKNNSLSNSIAIPVSEKYEGQLQDNLIVSLDVVKNFTVFSGSEINMGFNNKIMYVTTDIKDENGIYTKIKMINQTLKM